MSAVRKALYLSLVFLPLAALAQRGAQPTDAYGYTLFDSTAAECTYHFVDISATGIPIDFTASGAPAADDDGGAVVPLAEAFELYGAPATGVVVSTNGYFAMAPSLLKEDGGDFSNDPRLPAIPGNTVGSNARVLVYHDDLSGAASGGTAYHQHFAACPRPAASGIGGSCTVIQWNDWGFADRGDVLSFETILYHESFEVTVQVGVGDSAQGATSTRGLQDADCGIALQHRETLPGATALCFLDPRFPAGGLLADLSVKITDETEVAVPGTTLRYTIVASNSRGPSPVTGAVLTDDFPAALDCAWTCQASPGSSCTPAGSGDIADTVDLGLGGAVTYTAECDVAAGATGSLVNSAMVSPPPAVSDPDPSSNTAVDADAVDESVIFVDGFESGTVTWCRR